MNSGEVNSTTSPNLEQSSQPYDACSEKNCVLCQMIDRKAGDDWCFDWLRHLKDFEISHKELAEKDRQVLLSVDHTDYEVRHIRSKLAILQTQTVIHEM
jgi:hypothetical protein